jgi:hypothetical protein
MPHGNDDQLLHADIFQAHIPHFNVRRAETVEDHLVSHLPLPIGSTHHFRT